MRPILDRSEGYSGVYAHVSLSFYAFNTNGSKGVACGLGNIQKVRDGEFPEILKEANKKIADMVREESDKALAQILKNASERMKIRYHRGDN